jgi:multidrug transporter EmrE-like cation transporter
MAPAQKNRFLNRATIVAVTFAFVVWGGWAFWVNLSSGDTSQALRSGMTQGIYSAVMTFYMSFVVYFFWQKTRHLRLWWLLPTLATVGHTGLLLVGAHILNHTPNVAKTVSVPLIVAAGYCLFLTRNFQKKRTP